MKTWQKWTAPRDAQLLKYIAEKKPRAEIAKIMGSTVIAIKARVYDLGYSRLTRAKSDREFNLIWIACAERNGQTTVGIPK